MFEALINNMPSIGDNMHKDRIIATVIANCGFAPNEASLALDMAIKGVDDAVSAVFRSVALIDDERIAMQALSLAFQFLGVAAETHHNAFVSSVKELGATVAREDEDGKVRYEGPTPHKFAVGQRVEIHARGSIHYGHNGEVTHAGWNGTLDAPAYTVRIVTGPAKGIDALFNEDTLRAE